MLETTADIPKSVDSTADEQATSLNSQSSILSRVLIIPARKTLDMISAWSVVFKVRFFLMTMVVLPFMGMLLVHEIYPEELTLALAVLLLLAIIGFSPISNVLSYLIVGKELRDIEKFCLQLKEGNYAVCFDLPHEEDNEHEILTLKRNLNWMAHVISHRESHLSAALEGAHEEKKRYKSLSDVDHLTGLANRRCAMRELENLMREAAITGQKISMMFIDCDKFKQVNDIQGHQAGDMLLQDISDIIRQNVRQNADLPFRYGGDEFGVICPGVTPEKAAKAAERIRARLDEHCQGETTLSIGIAGCEMEASSDLQEAMAELIGAADEATYQAKSAGGNRIAPEMAA